MKTRESFHKKAFWFLWIISIIGILVLGTIAYNYKSKYEEFKIGSVELMKIMLDAQTACMDYANLTNDEFQDVFFEWGVEEIRNEKITPEVIYNNGTGISYDALNNKGVENE